MKKIITFVLLLAMIVMVFAACGEKPEEPKEPVSYLGNARDYVYTMYKNSPEKTVADYKLIGVAKISGQSYDITWTVDVKEGVAEDVKLVKNDDKTVTVDINEKPDTKLVYTLTATLKEGDKTASVSFEHYVPAVVVSNDGIVHIDEPKTNVAFKYALVQANLEKTLFFAGEMSGNYLATTEDLTKAVDMYLEDADEGYRMYFVKDGTKNYVEVYEFAEGKAGVHITTEPTTVAKWDSDMAILIWNVAGSDRYLGTYNTYNTISASATTYITGDNASKVGISQFPAYLCTVRVSKTNVTELKTGTPFKFALDQANLGKTLYFSGEMSGSYLATTDDFTKAVDMIVEEVEGGYRMYFVKDGAKNYVEVYEYAEGKAGVHITTEPTTVATWNTDMCILIWHVAESDRYIGTYNTYNTMSASATTYITGDNAAKVGISQFPSYLVVVNVPTKVVKAPAENTAYKFSLTQANRGEKLFFTGSMNGSYLATSTSLAEAVDVYVEKVDDNFRLYFLDGETKNYVEIYEYAEGKAGVHITTEPTNVYTWNDEMSILVSNVAESDRYLGTYNTYNTISASATTYITGDNAAKVGISQFPAYLVVVGF